MTRPYDPERGLRGAMSATLVLEGIVILLAIPVARNGGTGVFGIIAICVLALASITLCAFVSRPWFLTTALSLQVLVIVGWAICVPLGIMGIVFALVWAAMLWMRTEFRRRLAAGTLPGLSPPP